MPTSPLPVLPSSSGYDGPVSAAWQALRGGAVRAAATELARLGAAADVSPEQQAAVSALRMDTLLSGGHLEEAITTATALKLGLARASGPGALQVTTTLHLALGQLEEAVGDHVAALSHFTAAGRAGGDDSLRPWRSGAAVALVRTGRRHEGATLALEQVEVATVAHDDRALAMGLRTLAITGPGHQPTQVLRRASALAASVGDRRLRAQIDTDLAALLVLSAGHCVEEVVALLRGAETYTFAEGLWPGHARAVRLLGHVGEGPRSPAGETLTQLTPAERRVARLAARGLTNRQIAEQLLVTVKGVEWHLSRVYKKLGISSRTRLVGMFSQAS